MYKSFTAKEFKKLLNIPSDYSVEGFISYGAWDEAKHFAIVAEALDELGIAFTSQKLDGFLSHVLELTIDNNIYWMTVMYGGAQLSEHIHLASLFGSKRNIHIGSCGGLYNEMKSLDMLIPSWSYGNESTTRAYEPEAIDFKHYSDTALSRLLGSNVQGDYKIWDGPVVTNQAMMGETWEDVQSWSKNGFYGVEMETATMFAVSKHFHVPSAALLYVSDNMIKGQTAGDDSHLQEKAARELAKRAVYKAGLRTLIAPEK